MGEAGEVRAESKVPHKAVVLVRAELMEAIPSGKLLPLPEQVSKTYIINGESHEECSRKVELFFKELSDNAAFNSE